VIAATTVVGLAGVPAVGRWGLAAALGALAGKPVPLVPSREQARDWAVRELSDPAYARAQPGLLQRAVRWLLDRLAELQLPTGAVPDARTGLVLLLVVLALVLAVVLTRTGRLRGSGRVRQGAAVFAGSTLTAARHRELADAAAARADWADAVRERFRAVVRALEERTVLDERPGRTADEAAAEAAHALPDLASALGDAAGLFDEVVYGGRPAQAEHDARLRTLDSAVAAARPAWDAAVPAGSDR
jgi:hypothetical protein